MRAAILCALLLAGPVQAQVPQIGRLFTTAAERQQLDLARQRGGSIQDGRPSQGAQPAPVAAPPPAPAPPPVAVSGFVKRSSGSATVWVNGEARAAGPQGYVVRTPDGRSLTIKPGQEYDPVSGSVRNAPAR
jgi:hypothetical protein